MSTAQLTGHEVFRFLRSDQMNAVSSAAEEISLRAGDVVFRRGDRAEDFYVLLEGQVSLRLPRAGGVTLLIDEAREGAVFGSCVCLERDTYTLSAQCTLDSRLLKIRASILKQLMDRDKVIGYAIQSLISRVYFQRYVDTMEKLQAVVQSIPLETA
ncbi:MAG: cyclic nucleotide-binding domain-containing protein [Acidobacteria bacterium]|nr:cyclic nucleotide-binding domain-containing protein [Acidobacteriota bacterium]